MHPSGLTQRLAALPGARKLKILDEFDPRNDLHVDRAATFLVGRFHRENDVEALALLFEISHPRLVEIARQVARQLAVAIDPDDLVAGFMSRLFADVRRPQPAIRRFLGLAHTSMRNDARNQLRQHTRMWRRNLVWHRMQPPPADPSRVADDKEQTEACRRIGLFVLGLVSRCFHTLRERDRATLLLREVDGLSYQELAEALDVPANQVGTIVRRARQRLANRIGKALAAQDGDGREAT